MLSVREVIGKYSQRLSEKRVAAKRAFESRENFVKWLETDETAHGRTEERSIWKNEDLDLTLPKQWTWGWYDYAAFWWSYGFSVGVWSVGSSMVAMGLSAWQGGLPWFL
jgi:nucleobase:cation symporter-1, NCS1 family